jgi:hypothetical protein
MWRCRSVGALDARCAAGGRWRRFSVALVLFCWFVSVFALQWLHVGGGGGVFLGVVLGWLPGWGLVSFFGLWDRE